MDFFPDLGEPGFLDELFYFGPFLLQVMLGLFFFWLTGRRMKGTGWGIRIVSMVGMVLAADLVIFVVFGMVLRLSNPSLF